MIGIVHGLAGSAAVALLVLSTIHSPVWATVYLLIFGAGTMVGMMCMTAVMAVPLAYAGSRFTSVSRVFQRRVRCGECLLRILSRLPARLSGRSVHQPSAVDAALENQSKGNLHTAAFADAVFLSQKSSHFCGSSIGEFVPGNHAHAAS